MTAPHRPPFAQTVVWRHPCHCESASRPLAPGEEPEHRFDVDGEPFPWHIAEAGATFRRHVSIYLVSLVMFPLKRVNNEVVTFSHELDRPPTLGEVTFPWALFGPLTYTVDAKDIPILELTFIAKHVDADVEITEYQPPPEESTT